MRLLIVEDDKKIANALKRGLERQAFAVDLEYDADGGMAMATTEPYDLIVLDRMLPGQTDGIGIVKAMREKKINTPVLILTAKDKILDKAKGLNAGADDYLVKPFAFIEFIARVRALLRRPQNALDDVLDYNGLTLDRASFTVKRDGKKIDLTTREFALLEYLMVNSERTLTKDDILQHVWNYDSDVLPNTIEVYIGYLRSKIDKPFEGPNLIHTKRGFGYRLGEE